MQNVYLLRPKWLTVIDREIDRSEVCFQRFQEVSSGFNSDF